LKVRLTFDDIEDAVARAAWRLGIPPEAVPGAARAVFRAILPRLARRSGEARRSLPLLWIRRAAAAFLERALELPEAERPAALKRSLAPEVRGRSTDPSLPRRAPPGQYWRTLSGVGRALQGLEPLDREILGLDEKGLKPWEISVFLALPLDSVHSRLSHSRARLKDFWRRWCRVLR
jgi:DNA-directed RNA polymerase specialized sigma24 family protein